MDILVIGTGYVGLVTGACFAKKGHFVTCIDIDVNKIDLLQKGEVPFYEPGLQDLVLECSQKGTLRFRSDYPTEIKEGTLCFLALPTPSLLDGSCNTVYLERATNSIAQAISGYTIIVNKSTAPMGTTRKIEEWITADLKKRGKQVPFDVVSNPEFLKEGAALHDCMHPDRVVLGAFSQKAISCLLTLYASFVPQEKILCMSPSSAELTKYASNAMLALRISFMNEMANLCEKSGANIQEVKLGIGSDARIGDKFLNAGIGYGGSCFPKDLRALANLAKEYQVPFCILDAVEKTNERQKKSLVAKMETLFASQGGLIGKEIAIWGLAFKPETDDMREAPSLVLISSLLMKGASVRVYDPVAMKSAKNLLPDSPHLVFAENPYESAQGTDAICLVTEWKEFSSVDFTRIVAQMRQPLFLDGRNLYDPLQMAQYGLHYIGIGIPQPTFQPYEIISS